MRLQTPFHVPPWQSASAQHAWQHLDTLEAAQRARDNMTLITHATARPQRVKWLWKDWMQRGEVTLVTGKRGTGKSKLLHKIVSSFARAHGSVWLWIGVEEQAAWERRAAHIGDTRPGVVAFARQTGDTHPALMLPDTIALCECEYGRCDGVVLDPASSLVDEDNSNPAVRRAVESLARLPQTILAVKHTRKGATGEDDDSRGAGEWQDVPSGHVRIERVDENVYALGKHKQREGTTQGVMYYEIAAQQDGDVAMPCWLLARNDPNAYLDDVLAQHYADKRTRVNGDDVHDLADMLGEDASVSSERLRDLNASLGWGKDRTRIGRAMKKLGFTYTPPNKATGLARGVWQRVV